MTHLESQQEHLHCHPPEALLLGHPRNRQVEAGSFSFVILYVQKLLEISITSRVELKILEGEIKGRGGRLPSDFTGDEN